MADQIDLKDPLNRQPLTITIARKGDVEVIGHQRKPRPAHLKALTASMQRMGFVTPLVAVERDGKYVVIDGQHRFQAGVDLGVKEFPVVVVPEKLARRMMSLNIEQSLNIRERSTIALSIYREMLEESPTRTEDDGEVPDHDLFCDRVVIYEKKWLKKPFLPPMAQMVTDEEANSSSPDLYSSVPHLWLKILPSMC